MIQLYAGRKSKALIILLGENTRLVGYFSGMGLSGYESSTIEYLKYFMFDLDKAPCLTVSE